MYEIVEIFGDGSCRNIKGELNDMGVGIYIPTLNIKFYEYVGKGTSNRAEWEALIRSLRMIVPLIDNSKKVVYKSDSQIVVRIFNDIYSHRNFKCEYARAKFWAYKIKRLSVEWIPRTENAVADHLSKLGNPYYSKNLK